MAPEQILGKSVTPATDLYGLGVILYEILAGEKPFSGKSAPEIFSPTDRIMWEQLYQFPMKLSNFNPNIPSGLEEIVLRCLSKDPNDRFSNCLEFLASLELNINTFLVQQNSEPKQEIKPEEDQPAIGKKQRKDKKPINMYLFIAIIVISLVLVVFKGSDQGVKELKGNYSNYPITISYPTACMEIIIDEKTNTDLYECIDTITLISETRFNVNVEWRLSSLSSNGVIIYPDSDNHNMYLVDDLGNRIDHIATGGDADIEITLFNGESKQGWFTFNELAPDVTSFSFVDDDNGVQTPFLNKTWK